jgi:hypothetical protein
LPTKPMAKPTTVETNLFSLENRNQNLKPTSKPGGKLYCERTY